MSHRPLVFVSGLTLCDYLLWNWSLNSNHAALEVVSGLTLPPLAVALLWLAGLTIGRLLTHGGGRSARAEPRRAARRRRRARSTRTRARATAAQDATAGGPASARDTPRSAGAAGSSRGKIAA